MWLYGGRDEYDMRLLDKMVEEKKLTEAQRKVSCRPVPESGMLQSDKFLGDKHKELAAVVNRVAISRRKSSAPLEA